MVPLRVLIAGKILSEDLLTWENLARGLAASHTVPTILIHGAGEMTERILEGEGLDADRVLETGRPPGSLEHAFRRENKHITLTLTDHGVSSVGFLGVDRGMLQWEEQGLVARVRVLAKSARLGVVPVLGALAGAGPVTDSGSQSPSRLARRAAPGLAQVVEAISRQADFPEFYVGWLVPKTPDGPIVPEKARILTGEARLPEAARQDGVSVRVLGVSDVGSCDPDTGAALES